MDTALSSFVAEYQTRIEERLERLFSAMDAHDTRLIQAMRYSLLGGGKRMRPLMAYAAANACGEINTTTDDFASALECVHVYSLIHDDLPAMDDDALRRGKATCHIAYDEATAILAGDALQCLAFEILALSGSDQALQAIVELTAAAGARGMVIGQSIDLNQVDQSPSLDTLEIMHSFKTGAMIEASVVLGALSTNASSDQISALREFAHAIGLAFQVQDDILDVTADTQTLGKTQGADIDKNKPTYVSLLGLEKAQSKAETLCQQAIGALESFDEKAQNLRHLAHYIVQRSH